MFRKSYFYLLLIVAGGLIATAIGDDFCAAWFEHNGKIFPGIIRAMNDIFWIVVTVILVIRQVWRQQQVLQASEMQYRQLFEAHPNPMWIYRQDTQQFISVNEAALQQYGYTRDEWLKLTIRDIRPAEDLPRLEQVAIKSQDGYNDLGTWLHVRKSGQVFPVNIVSYPIYFKGESCRLVMATDITELVRSKEDLESAYIKEKELRQESRLRAEIINKIHNLVIIVGEDGLIKWVNKAFCEFTGYTLPEVVGLGPETVLHGPLTNVETMQRLGQAVQKKEFFSCELVNYKKTGEWYWSQLNISPIYDEAGVFQFFISVENVITEKKQREEKIIRQHSALQEIAWLNSHELRRPLCSVIALVELLKSATTAEEQDNYLRLLEQTASELDQLVHTTSLRISEIEK
ncbi:PAS domain S-box protein [Mucilaginibacter panaciglaebae]|uniref:histidine kinase n=1 Tax=Mucilaginibacter panaciglaebae TaxID=502331 RepID=A0ABP7WA66_9SPHI